MQSFDELLRAGIEAGASDIHLSVGRPPSARVDGEIELLGQDMLLPKDTEGVVGEIISESHRAVLERDGEVDFAYAIPSLGRFRVNVFRQRGTYAIAARILNLTIPEPEQLGSPEAVVRMTEKRRGLVLVTGATGSGKSTTLASLLNIINQTYSYHIITLEDAIVYLHRHSKSIVNQRVMGSDS